MMRCLLHSNLIPDHYLSSPRVYKKERLRVCHFPQVMLVVPAKFGTHTIISNHHKPVQVIPPILPAPLLQMGSYTIFPCLCFHVLLVSPTLLCHSFCDILLTLLNKNYNPTKHSLFKLGWETNVQISVAS